jgi:hypothetical protein
MSLPLHKLEEGNVNIGNRHIRRVQSSMLCGTVCKTLELGLILFLTSSVLLSALPLPILRTQPGIQHPSPYMNTSIRAIIHPLLPKIVFFSGPKFPSGIFNIYYSSTFPPILTAQQYKKLTLFGKYIYL